MMNYGCKGLNVVISGGTSGIGLATAEKFLADGANVFILGRSFLRGTMAVQKLQEAVKTQLCVLLFSYVLPPKNNHRLPSSERLLLKQLCLYTLSK